MDRPRRRVGLIGLAVGLAACQDDPIVPTAALTAEFRVVSLDGYTSEASAVLSGRSHEAVALPATDEVQITLPDWQVELVPRTDDGPWYYAVVPSAPAGEWHNFALLREDRPSAAINQTVLPLDPAPTVPATWSRSEPLVVTWSGVELPELLHIEVEGPCLEGPVWVDVPDVWGSFAFEPGTIEGQGSCGAQVTVSRFAKGRIDEALAGGSIEASQRREFTVEATP